MIASDIWCFRAIAAIGSLPRMTSITISYRFSTVQRLGLGIVPRPARMNCSPPPRCGKAAEAPLKNAPLQQLFHNVLVQIEIHLSLLCALNRSNSKTVPNFLGRDSRSTHPQYLGDRQRPALRPGGRPFRSSRANTALAHIPAPSLPLLVTCPVALHALSPAPFLASTRLPPPPHAG